jgi:hypothetical protein
MPKLLARFSDHTVPFWDGHGIRPLGFWTTLIGESSNELTYILPSESLGERETKWAAFQSDPAWLKARDDSERDGPIVASIRKSQTGRWHRPCPIGRFGHEGGARARASPRAAGA